jgi:hypothetical protein
MSVNVLTQCHLFLLNWLLTRTLGVCLHFTHFLNPFPPKTRPLPNSKTNPPLYSCCFFNFNFLNAELIYYVLLLLSLPILLTHCVKTNRLTPILRYPVHLFALHTHPTISRLKQRPAGNAAALLSITDFLVFFFSYESILLSFFLHIALKYA